MLAPRHLCENPYWTQDQTLRKGILDRVGKRPFVGSGVRAGRPHPFTHTHWVQGQGGDTTPTGSRVRVRGPYSLGPESGWGYHIHWVQGQGGETIPPLARGLGVNIYGGMSDVGGGL